MACNHIFYEPLWETTRREYVLVCKKCGLTVAVDALTTHDRELEGLTGFKPGQRVKLVKTDDRYTKLNPGDTGSVLYLWRNLDSVMIEVKWDSGSNLSMIWGVDRITLA